MLAFSKLDMDDDLDLEKELSNLSWDLDFLTVSDAPVIVEELPVPVFLLGLPALVILIPRSCSEEGIEEFTELGVVAQLVAPLLPPVTTVLEPHKPFIDLCLH